MTGTTDQVRDVAEQAEDSDQVGHLARVGLAARTVVWLVLAGLVVQLALGRGSGQTDQNGALRALAGTPWGGALVALLAAGFLVWAAHRLLCAAVGHRHCDGAKRWAQRAKSTGEGLVYLVATASAVRVLVGGRTDSEQQADSVTGAVMSVPGGRTLVGLAGVVVVAVGAVLAWRAVACKHSERLEHYRLPDRLRRPAVVVGVVGLLGRAGVVALLGGFVISAAVRFDPEGAAGLDGALQALATAPYGPVLLGLAAVGVLGYALWSAIETVWRDL